MRVVLDVAAAPGAGPAPATAALSRRAAGRLRRRTAPRRVVRVPPRVRPGRPDDALRAPRRRRPAAAAADPAAASGGADGRSVPAPRRVASGPHGGPSGAARPAPSTTRPAGTPLPLRRGLPMVVTLLDLAPWELPRGVPARHRVAVRPAAAGPVAARRRRGARRHARRSAIAARRLLHIRRDRIRVVPLRRARPSRPHRGRPRRRADAARERLGLPDRYLVYPGPLRRPPGPRPRCWRPRSSWPRPAARRPGCRRTAVAAADPGRRCDARTIARRSPGPRRGTASGDVLVYAPRLPDDRLAALVRGRAPWSCRSCPRRAGSPRSTRSLPARRSSPRAVGALPEIVGSAGHPRRAARPAAAGRGAIATAWADDRVTAGIEAAARTRASRDRRTWVDVATETRRSTHAVGTR